MKADVGIFYVPDTRITNPVVGGKRFVNCEVYGDWYYGPRLTGAPIRGHEDQVHVARDWLQQLSRHLGGAIVYLMDRVTGDLVAGLHPHDDTYTFWYRSQPTA